MFTVFHGVDFAFVFYLISVLKKFSFVTRIARVGELCSAYPYRRERYRSQQPTSLSFLRPLPPRPADSAPPSLALWSRKPLALSFAIRFEGGKKGPLNNRLRMVDLLMESDYRSSSIVSADIAEKCAEIPLRRIGFHIRKTTSNFGRFISFNDLIPDLPWEFRRIASEPEINFSKNRLSRMRKVEFSRR